MAKRKEIDVVFDPSNDYVLGSFGNDVHIKTDEAVIIVPREEYFRLWNIWLDTKRDYCERWNEYCGVMGYFFPLEYKIPKKKIILNEWSESDEDMRKVPYPVYYISKFEDICDMEHG